MRILFFGDIVGRSGREGVKRILPKLQSKFSPDLVIANADNAAHGFGISKSVAEELFALGINVLTGGNHIWDQKDSIGYITQTQRILRPLNYPNGTPGAGYIIARAHSGAGQILVLHLQGQYEMPQKLDSPFSCAEQVLEKYALKRNVDAIFVDFHAEMTSEKSCLGNFLDGKVSAVIGTHTHVPSADHRIFPNGTAYMTDVGMCGNYDSILGMEKQISINRMAKQFSLPYNRLAVADGEATVCCVVIETDDKSGLATSITPIRSGRTLVSFNEI
ncbi:MAG: TIGR00282 family metallophosphoesterase [Holosporales bacterium]|jgi:metallophosphoesterase (TIGR00282 family)|nr:TIGR00282 family metallophosphoesterase [Holosporales bacterium]